MPSRKATAALDLRAAAARFWPKVDKTATCWLWTGAKNEKGYGVIGRGARGAGLLKTHRLSWELARGPIPDGLFVLHRCDVPACVNPEHLFLGSNLDNIRDMRAKGRAVNPPVCRGERNAKAKITSEVADLIRAHRALGATCERIAVHLGVSIHVVYSVCSGKTWRVA